jgi:phage terminase large subunit-like protein
VGKRSKEKNDSSPAPSSSLDDIILLLPGYNPHDQAGECRFDEAAAAYAIAFIEECCKLAKGSAARAAGTPFLLEPWQKAIVANLFGWKRADGTRRYRECLIYVAKKNGKTAFVAAVMLYVLCCDNEFGAELYSAASCKEQASLLFSHAIGMVRQESELSSRLTVYGAKGGSQQRAIVYESMMAAYKCLCADADTGDGVNPHFAAIDELHRHASPELAEVLQKSTAARRQPLVLYTTTADYNRPSLCNTMVKRAREVRDNKGDRAQPGYDPAFLPVVYEADAKDDFKLPATWRKANPNLGVTVTEEFLARECLKAQEMPTELNNFLRLHLNIVTDADEAWMSGEVWRACSGLREGETPQQWRERMLEELKGKPCYLGWDLSAKIDLTALVAIWRPDNATDPWIIIPWFWVPAETAKQKEETDRVPYATWARQGFVIMTEGNVIDQQAVRAQVKKLASDYPLKEIGFDPYKSEELVRQLMEEDGLKDQLIEVRQGSRSLSEPMLEVEALAVSNRIQHGNNPAMAWMMGNVCAKRDENGNIQPNKKKSTGKIDGPVALFTGMARAVIGQDTTGPGIYLL